MSNVEEADTNSQRKVFPSVDICGCSSHLCQSARRCIQNSGLCNRYANDNEFALRARRVPAFAFVPQNKIRDCILLTVSDGLNRGEGLMEETSAIPRRPAIAFLATHYQELLKLEINKSSRTKERDAPQVRKCQMLPPTRAQNAAKKVRIWDPSDPALPGEYTRNNAPRH